MLHVALDTTLSPSFRARAQLWLPPGSLGKLEELRWSGSSSIPREERGDLRSTGMRRESDCTTWRAKWGTRRVSEIRCVASAGFYLPASRLFWAKLRSANSDFQLPWIVRWLRGMGDRQAAVCSLRPQAWAARCPSSSPLQAPLLPLCPSAPMMPTARPNIPLKHAQEFANWLQAQLRSC